MRLFLCAVAHWDNEEIPPLSFFWLLPKGRMKLDWCAKGMAEVPEPTGSNLHNQVENLEGMRGKYLVLLSSLMVLYWVVKSLLPRNLGEEEHCPNWETSLAQKSTLKAVRKTWTPHGRKWKPGKWKSEDKDNRNLAWKQKGARRNMWLALLRLVNTSFYNCIKEWKISQE